MKNQGLVLATLILAAIAIQFVPYGRDHGNPDVLQEPKWDAPRTRDLFFRGCGNCHSNETTWPWYSSVAPASWLVRYDVDRGRGHLNVSEWGRPKNKGDEAAEEVREGEMPPWFYVLFHPGEKFTPAEREEFVHGLINTFGDKPTREEQGKNR